MKFDSQVASLLVLIGVVDAEVYPPLNHINEFLNIGFKHYNGDSDAINCQNGEMGADFDVLSYPNCDGRKVSPTGSSYLDMSCMDQRWKYDGNKDQDCPSGSSWKQTFWPKPAYSACVEYHYTSDECCAPIDGVDWTGNMATTSSGGKISLSNTDVYAELANYLGLPNDVGIVAANSNSAVQSNSDAHYYPFGYGPGDSYATGCKYGQCEVGISKTGFLGQLPENSNGSGGVGMKTGVDLTGLKNQVYKWFNAIPGYAREGRWTKQKIENRNKKDGSGPYIVELLGKDEQTPNGANKDITFQVSYRTKYLVFCYWFRLHVYTNN